MDRQKLPPTATLTRRPDSGRENEPVFLAGRAEELDRVRQAVRVKRLMQVSGRCGYGKTTLLRYVAAHAVAEGLAGFSAYLPAGRGGTADLLHRLIGEIYTAEPPVKMTPSQCGQILSQVQALVIFDDASLSPAQLGEVRRALPACSLLVSSQQPIQGSPEDTLELSGLDEEAALQVLAGGLGRPLRNGEQPLARQLARAVHGHPLHLRQAAALARDGQASLAELAGMAMRDPGRLDRLSISALEEPARQALAVLALAAGAFLPAELVGLMGGITEIAACLRVLRRRGLAEQRQGRFGLSSPATTSSPAVAITGSPNSAPPSTPASTEVSSSPSSSSAGGSPARPSVPRAKFGRMDITGNPAPPTKVLTIHNPNSQLLAITGVQTTAPFSITRNTCRGSPVPAQGWCSITVQFAPSAIGSYRQDLTVRSAAGKSAALLTGTGYVELMVVIDGDGQGTVSDGDGLDCSTAAGGGTPTPPPAGCSRELTGPVTLTATALAGTGSLFGGWGTSCPKTGKATCVVGSPQAVTADTTVTADFYVPQPTVPYRSVRALQLQPSRIKGRCAGPYHLEGANMNAHAVAASAAVTSGSRWIAVLFGVAVPVLLYLVTATASGQWNPWKLVAGADGWASTSKLQWFLWIVVILFSYTALWVLRAEQGHYSELSHLPVNVLTVLGFSAGTAAAAKGITSAYVQTGRVSKAAPPAGRTAAARPKPGILNDDTGTPELAKIQVMGFTLLTIGIFLATVIHQIVSHPVITSLPSIDTSLLAVTAISQGGYLGKKLVTFGSPALTAADPPTAAPRTSVMLQGANLGASPAGSLLTLNGAQIPFTRWSDSTIVFSMPGTEPATNAAWNPPQKAQLAAVVGGVTSNSITITVA